MKQRHGFISNSSSSSFLCYNTKLTVSDVKQIISDILADVGDELAVAYITDEEAEDLADFDRCHSSERHRKASSYKKKILIKQKTDNSFDSTLFFEIEKRLQGRIYWDIF